MSKLEQVAEAIWNAEGVRAAGRRLEGWGDVSDASKDKYRLSARAAIEAMRGLDATMHAAIDDILCVCIPGDVEERNAVGVAIVKAHRAMINAILSETKP